jgi:SulP family sulfate permease
MNLQQYQREWFGNVPKDLISGLVVALALIPEAIAFSIIAGVDPRVGLYSSFCIAVVIAFMGGRPGMISAATGAMALLMITLVKNHGLEYLLLATVATGVVQMICGWLKLGDMLRFVSSSVMTGFVNALAILIFMAQLTEFQGQGVLMFGMVAAGLAIIYLFPRLVRSVPSPLVCIVVLTAVSLVLGLDLRTVGDMGALPATLPIFAWPQVPWTLETLVIIAPYVAALTVVGLLESLLTASIVDDLTDTESNKNRECVGQGAANVVAGCFGGMAGCAMIGQTVINVKSGGRGRLSCFAAGVFLMAMILLLADWVKVIPMAALVAVMIMVSIGTFNWGSLKKLRTNPKMASFIMITTVLVTVFTHNLAIGVGIGVILSAFSFARKAARLVRIGNRPGEDGKSRTYFVEGNLFFVSVSAFSRAFDFREVLPRVTIDLTRAHFWDISSIAALDRVVLKFRRNGTEVTVVGLNEASATLVERFATHDKPGADQASSLH